MSYLWQVRMYVALKHWMSETEWQTFLALGNAEVGEHCLYVSWCVLPHINVSCTLTSDWDFWSIFEFIIHLFSLLSPFVKSWNHNFFTCNWGNYKDCDYLWLSVIYICGRVWQSLPECKHCRTVQFPLRQSTPLPTKLSLLCSAQSLLPPHVAQVLLGF